MAHPPVSPVLAARSNQRRQEVVVLTRPVAALQPDEVVVPTAVADDGAWACRDGTKAVVDVQWIAAKTAAAVWNLIVAVWGMLF